LPPRRAAVVQVFVFRGGQFVGTDVFAENRFVVGRDPASADLVLESTEVSRAHAIIEHDGERVFIRDAGSTNGVYLNDRRVESAEVRRLDQVLLGDYTLKIKLLAQADAAATERQPTRVAPSDDAELQALREQAEAAPAASRPGIAIKAAPPVAARAAVKPVPMEVPAAVDERHGKKRGKKPSPPSMEALADLAGDITDSDAVAQSAALLAQAPAARQEPPRPAPAPSPAAPPAARPVPKAAPALEAPPRAPVRASEPPPPAPLAARQEPPPPIRHDEEEEDEEEHFEPPFSLAEHLVASPGARLEEANHIEVITVRDARVFDSRLLAAGESMWTGVSSHWFGRKDPDLPPRRRLVHLHKSGRCQLEIAEDARGSVLRGGSRLSLAQLATRKKAGRATLLLERGDAVQVNDQSGQIHIRFVRPPTLPVDRRTWRDRLKPEKTLGRSMMGSAGGHVALLLLGVLLPAGAVAPPAPTETFAEVQLDKELKLEEPKAEPPKQPEPQPVAAPQPVAKSMEAAPNKHAKAGGTSKAPPGVLGLLSKTGSSAAPGPAAALAAVSNLSAANAPAGASGFRVSGLVGKLPTGDILIGGGGGGVNTKGGATLLRGGGGGAGQLAGQGDRQVGGIVQKVPQEMRSAGQGSLDRDAIQKVINANVGQIQRCYERELVQTPGLSGKVEIEWTVAITGAVKSARQKFSSLNSPSAVNCIIDHIKGWRFPQPHGGEVMVSYPFVFKSINY
jgi:hypothetical protein